MTKRKQIYKCEICGNIVEVTHEGNGQLVCCGVNMVLQEEKNQTEGLEKHIPVIEENGNNITVKVGDTPHPMEEAHYIEWIELTTDGTTQKIFLTPSDSTEVTFEVKEGYSTISARAYCNIHGLWSTEK